MESFNDRESMLNEKGEYKTACDVILDLIKYTHTVTPPPHTPQRHPPLNRHTHTHTCVRVRKLGWGVAKSQNGQKKVRLQVANILFFIYLCISYIFHN